MAGAPGVRGLWLALLLVVLAVLAWRITALGVARIHVAALDQEGEAAARQALDWYPGQAAALYRLADPYTHLTPRHPAATLPAHESLWPMVRHPPTRAHPGCRASGAHPQPPRPGGTGV